MQTEPGSRPRRVWAPAEGLPLSQHYTYGQYLHPQHHTAATSLALFHHLGWWKFNDTSCLPPLVWGLPSPCRRRWPASPQRLYSVWAFGQRRVPLLGRRGLHRAARPRPTPLRENAQDGIQFHWSGAARSWTPYIPRRRKERLNLVISRDHVATANTFNCVPNL